MKRDLGVTLDKSKKELKSGEGKKEGKILTLKKQQKEGRDLKLNLLALDCSLYCLECSLLAIVGICATLFISSSTNIFHTSLISS